MGRLTTHVLDTTRGRPGNDISITLYRVEGELRHSIKTVVTNNDGRCDNPLLENNEFAVGVYELLFSVGSYFSAQESSLSSEPNAAEPRFLDDVIVRFGVSASDQHYHVPLLITPYSYSVYRGS